MSKLDDIIWSAEYTTETQKQMVKDLMLELIGESTQVLVMVDDIQYLNGGYINASELREKVEEL